MSAEFHLAWRFLFEKRHGAWGRAIGMMAMGSVALGVAALIITLSVMSGFQEDIRQRLIGIRPHLILSSPIERMSYPDSHLEGVLEKTPEIQAWSPFVSGQVLIGYEKASSGAFLKGIDPEQEKSVLDLSRQIRYGSFLDQSEIGTQKPPIVLGEELARNLGARVGQNIWIMPPNQQGFSPLSIPKVHLFELIGVIKIGLYDYDSTMAFLKLNDAQQLFNLNHHVSGIGVRLKDPDEAEEVSRSIQNELEGNYWVRSWLSLNQNLFAALKLEKIVMFIILTLVTIVASFMIVSNLFLTISQKSKEIGILRAIGMSAKGIKKIFLLQGLLMGAIGNSIGVVVGLIISLVLSKTKLITLPAEVYYLDRLPIQINPLDILVVLFASMLIVLIATLFPAFRASQLNPVDAIRTG